MAGEADALEESSERGPAAAELCVVCGCRERGSARRWRMRPAASQRSLCGSRSASDKKMAGKEDGGGW